MIATIVTTFVTLIAWVIGFNVIRGLLRWFGIYTTVEECHSKVYVLFGKVIGEIDKAGLTYPFVKFGPRVLMMPFFGKVYTLDQRLDQRYLRSRAVNTEEGTPMGIGVWYEMRVSDPVAYLFENSDPAGSLEANVTNATVRSLSNMPLAEMLEDRHQMSRTVRAEVSPKSRSWGYDLGSVYIRKVHFRDAEMIDQIEQKVVNRLRQVTSAIRQAGANRVDVVTSRAEKDAAVEFARAQAMRPKLVGDSMARISTDPEVLDSLLEILQIQSLVETEGELVLLPGTADSGILPELLAAREEPLR